MKNKNLILFIISFLIFFFLIFFINIIFFENEKKDDYENTIEKYEDTQEHNTATWTDDFSNIDSKVELSDDVKKRYDEILSEYKTNLLKKEEELSNNLNIKYTFLPDTLESSLLSAWKLSSFYSFFASYIFSWKNIDLWLNFSTDFDKIRWKYKWKNINLFWVDKLSKEELLAVFIHEFWHYIDIDFSESKFSSDVSQEFYDISWEKTTVIKWWQKISDFVSGYAMTNKYEDFAESFIYYILHNWDFFSKSQKSEILNEKYNFFSEKVFTNWEFKNTNFSKSQEVLDYYWDITKIDYFLEKLLNYLES